MYSKAPKEAHIRILPLLSRPQNFPDRPQPMPAESSETRPVSFPFYTTDGAVAIYIFAIRRPGLVAIKTFQSFNQEIS